MSGFSPKQVTALRRKLARQNVHSREVDGRSIDYVEGWFAIAQANAIFGFDGWDREMTHFERLYERSRNDRTNCGYVARTALENRSRTSHRQGRTHLRGRAAIPGQGAFGICGSSALCHLWSVAIARAPSNV
jgi:hypothetical protein